MQKKLTCYRCKKKFDGDPAQGNLCEECRKRRQMSSFNCEHCNTAITVHADELTREQIEGLKADLGYVDIYNDKTCHFSIIKYA